MSNFEQQNITRYTKRLGEKKKKKTKHKQNNSQSKETKKVSEVQSDMAYM